MGIVHRDSQARGSHPVCHGVRRRDVGGFDVWSSFFLIGGLGIGELVWAQRTARTAPARSTT